MSAAVATARPADVPASQRAEAGEQMQVDTARDGDGAEEDLYTKLKTLQRQLEFLEIQVRPPDRSTQAPPAAGRPGGCGQPARRGRGWQVLAQPSLPVLLACASGLSLCLCIASRLSPFFPWAQEEYIKEEQRQLRSELLRAAEEVRRIQVCAALGARCVGCRQGSQPSGRALPCTVWAPAPARRAFWGLIELHASVCGGPLAACTGAHSRRVCCLCCVALSMPEPSAPGVRASP